LADAVETGPIVSTDKIMKNNFEKFSGEKKERREEVEIIHTDPDSIRLYTEYSKKYITVDLKFPNVASYDQFLESERTLDKFIDLDGRLILGGESVPIQMPAKTSDNYSALDSNPDEEDETPLYEKHGITHREFQIIQHIIEKQFFTKKP